MLKKILVCLTILFFSHTAFSDDYIQTGNALQRLCGGNNFQQWQCLAYLRGYMDGVLLTNTFNTKMDDKRAAQISSLTVVREINNDINKKPAVGDYPAAIVVARAYFRLGVWDILDLRKKT